MTAHTLFISVHISAFSSIPSIPDLKTNYKISETRRYSSLKLKFLKGHRCKKLKKSVGQFFPTLGIMPTDETAYRTVAGNIEEESVGSKTMWAKLGQRFNSAGIMSSLRVIFREQHLALPHLNVPDIRWVNWKELKEQGFQGIVFDKDNTLTAPYAPSLWPAIADSLEDCKSIFHGRIALLSNSAGLYQFDPDGSEAKALEELIGIPVIRHGLKKPSGTAKDIEKYFGYDPSLLVMVGDRHFTDIVYGNRNGFLTILTEPLTLAGEPFIVRQVRKLEGFLVQCWCRKGLKPASHHLLLSKHEYIKSPD